MAGSGLMHLPRIDAQALREARGTAGPLAFVVLPVAGLFWVDSLRSSIRAIWRLPQYPGNFFLRQLIDLAVLAGLGLLLAASLAATAGTETLLNWLLRDAAEATGPPGRWLLGSAGYLLGIGVNILLAIAALTALPRLRMWLRRVLAPALFAAAGLELLKTIGRLYVQRTEANPAYQVVTGAVAVLVFLSLLNQFILFAAALTATSTSGPVTDLAAAPPPTAPHRAPTAGATGTRCLSRRRRPARRTAGNASGPHSAPPVAVAAQAGCRPADAHDRGPASGPAGHCPSFRCGAATWHTAPTVPRAGWEPARLR